MMNQADLTERIARHLADRAGLSVAVEDVGGKIILSGLVNSAGEREAAADLVAEIAPDRDIDNALEVLVTLPPTIDDFQTDDLGPDDLPADAAELVAAEGEIAPDFTDQPLNVDVRDVSENAAEPFYPPTDPVMTTDARGQAQVLGGFSPDSATEVPVDRSAADGRPGDEALTDAVRRELREDALTTDLDVRVSVRDGVVRLRGRVAGLEDADAVEEVAARVPGVAEVVEDLTIQEL